MKVSCLILTFNEEINVNRCLSALDWCDDIVVIDSGSTDQTIPIAQRHGARILHRAFDTFAEQRNHGLVRGGFKNDWVLHLDADEVVTPELRDLIEAIDPEDNVDGYFLPSKTMLHNQWLKHSGMYPTYQARLGHRERLRFVQVGHGQREDVPPCRMRQIDEPYLHYSFSHGLRKWLEKHVRYADDEASLITEIRRDKHAFAKPIAVDKASERRSAKVKAASIPLALRPFARFLYIYIWRQGFRDGRAGFLYAFMLSVYEGMTAVLVAEQLRRSLHDDATKRPGEETRK